MKAIKDYLKLQLWLPFDFPDLHRCTCLCLQTAVLFYSDSLSIFLRNITRVVLTYAAKWLYAYHSGIGMMMSTYCSHVTDFPGPLASQLWDSCSALSSQFISLWACLRTTIGLLIQCWDRLVSDFIILAQFTVPNLNRHLSDQRSAIKVHLHSKTNVIVVIIHLSERTGSHFKYRGIFWVMLHFLLLFPFYHSQSDLPHTHIFK